MNKDDGGPAFPVGTANGLSLRDWFAGQVMCGGCSAPFTMDAIPEMARISYVVADAMLAARKDDQ